MECSSCEYLRRTFHWDTCCICKLKKLKRSAKVAPEPPVTVEMVKLKNTSVIMGSHEYETILNFRKEYELTQPKTQESGSQEGLLPEQQGPESRVEQWGQCVAYRGERKQRETQFQ